LRYVSYFALPNGFGPFYLRDAKTPEGTYLLAGAKLLGDLVAICLNHALQDVKSAAWRLHQL
jgi:hypothetical protein